MRFACRITDSTIQTHTHNIYYLLLFHGSNGYVNAHRRYVTRTLSVLLIIAIVWICRDKLITLVRKHFNTTTKRVRWTRIKCNGRNFVRAAVKQLQWLANIGLFHWPTEPPFLPLPSATSSQGFLASTVRLCKTSLEFHTPLTENGADLHF